VGKTVLKSFPMGLLDFPESGDALLFYLISQLYEHTRSSWAPTAPDCDILKKERFLPIQAW